MDFGLDSLVTDLNDTTISAEIAIEKISGDPNQPRREFDPDALNDLAESIQAQGMVQPIVLREDKDDAERYIIIAGERRWRASQIVGLKTVPAVIKTYDDEQIIAIQIIENVDRTGFILADEVRAVGRLVDEHKTQKAAGDAVGKGKTWIAKRLAIYKADDALVSFVDDGLTGDLEGAYQLSLLLKKYPEEGRALIQEMRDFPKKRNNFRQQVISTMERLNNPSPKPFPETEESIVQEETQKVSHEKLFGDAQGSQAITEQAAVNSSAQDEDTNNDSRDEGKTKITVKETVKEEKQADPLDDSDKKALAETRVLNYLVKGEQVLLYTEEQTLSITLSLWEKIYEDIHKV